MKPFIHNLVFRKIKKIDYIYLSGTVTFINSVKDSNYYLCLVSISGKTFSLVIIVANFTVNALPTFSFVRAMKFR